MSPAAVALASDRRGRVPFAVIGVLLLVASLAIAPTLAPEPAPSDTAVERALTEATAASQTAVRNGVATASRRAAADPVVEPADTSVGRALSGEEPFRDSLRLRVYLQVRANLDGLSARREGVRATASLPAVDSTREYERAIDRVRLERAGENGTALRATVENITVTARRSGSVVSRRNVSRTVVVPTPVLQLHERMETYERRLTNGLARPGLSQRLTGRLYPIAWSRGYAQFGGAPIANVIANRHVSLATNGALLGIQRSVFGRSDPAGRQALTEATAAVGINDIVAGSNSDIANQILAQTSYRPAGQNISTGGAQAPSPDESMRIGINATADEAFRSVGRPDALNATARAAYTVDAKVVTTRDHVWGGQPDRPDPPGPEWEFASETTSETAEVVDTTDGRETVPFGWHAFDRFGRTVDVTHTYAVTWVNGQKTERTRNRRTERFNVRAALVGRHRNESVAPVRGIETAHDASESPIGGSNLADIEPAAETMLLPYGRDPVAKNIAVGEFDGETVRVTGSRPDTIHRWLSRDLRRLRERVRNVSVTAERGSVGTAKANPAGRLRRELRQRRERLADVPDTYDSAAQRARIAVRLDYLDAVEGRLAGRERNHSAVESGLADRLGELSGGSLAKLRRGLTARETRVPRSRPAPTGPAGPVRTEVDAQPQYLTLASVSESEFPAVDSSAHPLVARNVNVFSVPYGNAVTEVLNAGTGGRNRVGLAAASKTLAAANETTPEGPSEMLDTRRGQLQNEIARANRQVIGSLQLRVRASTDAGRDESRAIVSDAMERWESTAARGRALANDSAAERVAEVAADRRGLSPIEADWLRLRLMRTATNTLSTARVRPEKGVVNRTANTVREVARSRLQSFVTDQAQSEIERVARKRLGQQVLPSGLPIAPPLYGWHATVNVWWVTVAGEYARFAVTAAHGTPAEPAARTTYAREDESVALDADGDGTAERLGSNEALSFRADTGVVIVVPPKPRGVGDKDGNSVETSAGWPEAG